MKLFATAGITEPHLSADPLGTEGEMSPGPDDENPYDADYGTDGDGPAFGGELPAFLQGGGQGVVDAGEEAVDDAADFAGERHEGAMNVFEYAPGKMGSFEPVDENGPFEW